jgi:uncharacterized protein
MAFYAFGIEPYWLQVTMVDVPVANLPKDLEGFTIVQIGDLHLGLAPGEDNLPRAIALANAQSPDLVVLTGDYVDAAAYQRVAEFAEQGTTRMAKLDARYGVYAILGNHDLLTGEQVIVDYLQSAGIKVLRDARQPLKIGNSTLWLLGVEDAGVDVCTSWADLQARYRPHADKMRELLDDIPPQDIRVLLTHNPDFSEIPLDARLDLTIAGHTHGGYIRLPVIGALIRSSCFGNRLTSRLVQGSHGRVYIDQGLGGVSLRFGDRPEISVLRLVSE